MRFNVFLNISETEKGENFGLLSGEKVNQKGKRCELRKEYKD